MKTQKRKLVYEDRYIFVGQTEDGTPIYEMIPGEEIKEMKEVGISDDEIAKDAVKDHPLYKF